MAANLRIPTLLRLVGYYILDIQILIHPHIVLYATLQHLREHLSIETARLVTLCYRQVEVIGGVDVIFRCKFRQNFEKVSAQMTFIVNI